MIKALVRATFVALLISAFIGVAPLPVPVPQAGALEAPPVFSLKWGTEGNGPAEFNAPDAVAVSPLTGDVYVADRDNDRVSQFSADGTPTRTWNTYGVPPRAFSDPTGVAVSPISGDVYVTDRADDRVAQFTSSGSYVGSFYVDYGPEGIAIDPSGNVYVAAAVGNRIKKFGADGTFVTQWGGYGTFFYPQGVAASATAVYVSDTYNHRVQKFTPSGTFVSQWGSYGTANGDFNHPDGITLDAGGAVYVVDATNDRIQKFSADGTFLTTWGTSGSDDGEFDEPSDVAVATSGEVYVVDRGNDRIQQFEYPAVPGIDITLSADETVVSAGEPIHFHVRVTNTGNVPLTGVSVHDEQAPACDRSIGDLPVGADEAYDCEFTDTLIAIGTFANQAIAESNEAAPAWSNWVDTEVFAAEGLVSPPDFVGAAGAGFFSNPGGVAVNQATRQLYVADSGNDRIVQASADGVYVREWGGHGTGPGEFDDPRGVAVHQGTGEVFVVDHGNNRVQHFTATGDYIGEWGGGFDGPNGIAVWPYQTLVYVADTGNDRVRVFAPEVGYEEYGAWSVPSPAGVAFGGGDHVLVTSLGNHRVLRTDPYGVLETQWGNQGSAPGQFSAPYGIGVDIHGNIYVADTGNHRIQQFNGDGTFLGQWGTEGTGNGEFEQPVSVATAPGGTVYVVDYGNGRVQEFDAEPTRVSGTLTDATTGEPVAGGWVAVLRTSDFSIAGGGFADGYGAYSALVGPGSYFLYLIDPTGDHVAGFHGPPTMVVVPADTVVPVDPSMTPTRGSIAGTVTDDDTGDPVAGAWAVTLSGTTGAPETGVTTDPDGSFSVGRLRPGNHYLVAIDPSGARRPEFHPNSPNAFGASPLAVTAGQATPVYLAPPAQTPIAGGSTLSGTVTESGTGTPLAGVYAMALRAADYRFVRGAVTDAAGQFSLNVVAGDYKVELVDSTGLHDMEWNDDHPYYDIALADAVAAPGTVNAALAPRTGTMAGTITDDLTGDPIEGSWVIAIAPNGIAGGAVTAADGTYTIVGLAPGTYRATFVDPVGGRTQEYWHDHLVYDVADPIAITVGATATIDEDLWYRDE